MIFITSILLVVTLDQWTKFIALSKLTETQSIPVIEGIFHFTLVYNKGVAFGLLGQYPTALFIVITLSLIALIFWSRTLMRSSIHLRWAMGLIVGGAIGNWIDRFRHGAVIDFFDFQVWPVFNIADSAISIGVLSYILILIRQKKVA